MPFRQLDIYKDSKNICLPVAKLRLSSEEITQRYGISFVDGRDDLDDFKGAVIASESGQRFGLVYYHCAPQPRGVEIWVYEHSKDLSAELAEFSANLPIPAEDYAWIHSDAKLPTAGPPANRRPPLPVFVATLCLALSFTAALVTWIFTVHWRNLMAAVAYAAICLLFFQWLRAIYRGRRWVKWLTIALIVSGLFRAPATLAHFASAIEQVRFFAQAILQCVAVILLLLPSSHRWYSK